MTMMERFQTYFERLERLSTEELDRSAEKLVRGEATSVALLIAHLAEMSRRKAALESGFKSLFDYCVRRLNLSEGSVALRLQVANVARRFPQVLVALAENRVSLSVAGMLAPHLEEENVERLLSDCAGMSKRAVEEYLVRLRPKPVFEPSIRKLPEPARVAPPRPEPVPALPVAGKPSPAPIVRPATRTQFNFRFSAERGFKEKLERLAEVLGVENAEKNLAELLEKAVDLALDKKDPKRKRGRRLAKTSATKPRPDEVAKLPSRYIPSDVRERVHERASYRCEYRGRDGTRCTSRTGLEIEHERPFAIFRSHDERYLKVLCERHNRLRAEQVYGAELIQRKIVEARARTD